MRHKLRTLMGLQAWELQILVEACILLPLVALGLRFWGFKALMRSLKLDNKAQAGQALARAEAIATLVAKSAANLPFHSSCLVRALSSARILQNHGFHADLLIGLRKEENTSITAHAWLEIAGKPLAERADIGSRYAAFPTNELKLKYFT
jgi:hypothetical protein